MPWWSRRPRTTGVTVEVPEGTIDAGLLRSKGYVEESADWHVLPGTRRATAEEYAEWLFDYLKHTEDSPIFWYPCSFYEQKNPMLVTTGDVDTVEIGHKRSVRYTYTLIVCSEHEAFLMHQYSTGDTLYEEATNGRRAHISHDSASWCEPYVVTIYADDVFLTHPAMRGLVDTWEARFAEQEAPGTLLCRCGCRQYPDELSTIPENMRPFWLATRTPEELAGLEARGPGQG